MSSMESWQREPWPQMDPRFAYSTDQVFGYAAAGDQNARQELDEIGYTEYLQSLCDTDSRPHLTD